MTQLYWKPPPDAQHDLAERLRRTCFIGIDPGLDGAVCAILEGAPAPIIFDMPTFTTTTGSKRKPTLKRHIDGVKLRQILHKLQCEAGDIYVALETTAMRSAVRPALPLVNGKPHCCTVCHQQHFEVNQGMASIGSFMRGGGMILGVLIGLQIPSEEVASSVWTAEVFHGRAEKLDHRKLAQQMFPSVAAKLDRVKDDGRADALLIADWIRRRKEAPF